MAACLLSLVTLLQPTLAADAYTSSTSATPKDNNANCSCYVVKSGKDSASPQYFQYYRFFDFRNLNGALTKTPPQLNDSVVAATATTWQPHIFDSDDWNADWNIQNWTKPATTDFPVPMNNSLANVYIGSDNSSSSSYLSLRTSRTDTYQTSAEIENQQRNLMHVSMRMYARVTGSKGAVAGFFTYFDDSNESDIEILTQDPTDQIRYTNQPSVDKHGNEIVKASVGPTNLPAWDEWQTHRIDWLPKETYWYINDQQVAANTYSVPRKPSYIDINMWGDGGEWSGNMTVGNAAEFQIQWIEMTFNTSGPVTGAKKDKRGASTESWLSERGAQGCETVCAIDDVTDKGTPEVLSSTPSAASGLGCDSRLLAIVAFAAVVLAL